MFHGRANEDVSTWVAKVSDFFYLTETTPRQQVAYAATLLQEAAADWWVALLHVNVMAYVLRIFRNLLYCWRKGLGVQPGWIEPGPLYVTSDKGKQRLCERIPPGSRPYWANSLRLTRIGQKPNLFGVCTRVWPNWSRLQGQRICIWQFARRKRLRWPGTLASGGQTGQKMQNQNRGRGRFQRGRGRFNAQCK